MRSARNLMVLCLTLFLIGSCSKADESQSAGKVVRVRKPIVWRVRKPIIKPVPEAPSDTSAAEPQAAGAPARTEVAATDVPEATKPAEPTQSGKGGSGGEQPVAVPQEPTSDSKGGPKEVRKLQFVTTPEGDEKVLIWLSGNHPPHIFALEGDRPRIVCDFIDARAGSGMDGAVAPAGRIITNIRIGVYKGADAKVRVVLDLAKRPSGDYEVQPIFYAADNIYAIVVK